MKILQAVFVSLLAFAAFADTVPIRNAEDAAISGNVTAYKMEKHRVVEPYLMKKRGNMFVCVDVEIENTGAEHEYSDWRFQLIDLANRRWDAFAASSMIKEPSIGNRTTLKPGEKIRGWVAFELPKNTNLNGFKIRYEQGKTISENAAITGYK